MRRFRTPSVRAIFAPAFVAALAFASLASAAETRPEPAKTPATKEAAAKSSPALRLTDKDIERVKALDAAPAANAGCDSACGSADAGSNAPAVGASAKKKPVPSRTYPIRPRASRAEPEPKTDPARPDWTTQKKRRDDDAQSREKWGWQNDKVSAYMAARRRQLEIERDARRRAIRNGPTLPPSGDAKDDLRKPKPVK